MRWRRMTASDSWGLSNFTVRPSESTLWNRIFTRAVSAASPQKPVGKVLCPDRENHSFRRSSNEEGLIGFTSGAGPPAVPVQSPPKSLTIPVASWNRARSFPFSKKM